MNIGGKPINVLDQLNENNIDRATRVKILAFIMSAPWNVHSANLGKAAEGIGGYRLVLMSPTLQTQAHTIVVPGMPPWP